MAAIISDNFRIDNAELFRSAFSADNFYMALGRIEPWTATVDSPVADDNNPPNPSDSVNSKSQIWRELIGAKKIQPSDVSLMLNRIDWASGDIYDEYDSADGELFQKNIYVMTDDYNIYKVISNANGIASTVKPTGTATTIFQTGDGYRWKFMYALSSIQSQKFLTPQFIPVSTAASGSSQEAVENTAIAGQIVSYKIINGGSGYVTAPTLTVEGNGTSATATAAVSGGEITSITVTGLGSGYDYATVTIGGPGVGAEIQANVAPPGGHGKSAIYELGAYYVGMATRFEYDESGDITTENDYRQVSIIRNPYAFGTTTEFTASTARQTTRLTVANATGYLADEQIVGNISGATGNIVEVDTDNDYLYVTSIQGTFTTETVTGQTSAVASAVSAIEDPALELYSGKLIYTETKKPQPRDDAQVERIITIVEW